MTCREISELLSSYLDEELEPEAHNLVEGHLLVCGHCRLALEQLRQVKFALQSLPELEPPPELHARIMSVVSETQEPEQSRARVSLKQRWPRLKMPFMRHGGLKTAGLVLAACLVVMIVSSAGTLFFIRRYGSLGAKKGIDDENFFRLMGGNASVPSAPEESGEIYGFAQELFSSGTDASLQDAPDDSRGGKSIAPSSLSAADTADIERKLIRRANLTLEVSPGGVDNASTQTMHIVRTYQGYIESSSMSVAQDKHQSTVFYMTARVPSEHLDQAIEEISGLGTVTQSDISEQDVTEQYVDLDARIKNKVVQEQRLLQILGNAVTVGELLQVEGELSRVRSDIESMKGRQNLLDKSSAMSFLTMAMVEQGARKPTPSPWSEIWKTFLRAWRDLFMFAAKIAPVAIVLGVGYFMVRRAIRKQP